MQQILVNATLPNELRIASVENGALQSLDVENTLGEQLQSNIYKARVVSVIADLEAAFIDFGHERNGFLPMKNLTGALLDGAGENPSISQLLKINDELIVQVQIDKGRFQGKGALLTTAINVPGRHLIIYPNSPNLRQAPRRLTGHDDTKRRLEELRVDPSIGFQLRSSGVEAALDVVQNEADELLRLWRRVTDAAENNPAPALLLKNDEPLLRALRDHLDSRVESVIVDDGDSWQTIMDWIQHLAPELKEKIYLHEEPTPLFMHHRIEEQVESVYKRRVKLPSGGSLVIDHTEALTAIDINSGSGGGGNMEDTALKTNREAADEIAHQLRLRDIGGQIVVDFIDMRLAENRKDIENRMRQAMARDPARPKIASIGDFCLLMMTRKRLRPSTADTFLELCPHCEGGGTRRTAASMAMGVLRHLEYSASNAADNGVNLLTLLASLDISAMLFNQFRDSVRAIEKRYDVEALIIPSAHLNSREYKLQTSADRGKTKNRALSAERSDAKSKSHEELHKSVADVLGLRGRRGRRPLVRRRAPGVDVGLLTKLLRWLGLVDKTAPKPAKAARPHSSRRRPGGGNSHRQSRSAAGGRRRGRGGRGRGGDGRQNADGNRRSRDGGDTRQNADGNRRSRDGGDGRQNADGNRRSRDGGDGRQNADGNRRSRDGGDGRQNADGNRRSRDGGDGRQNADGNRQSRDGDGRQNIDGNRRSRDGDGRQNGGEKDGGATPRHDAPSTLHDGDARRDSRPPDVQSATRITPAQDNPEDRFKERNAAASPPQADNVEGERDKSPDRASNDPRNR